MDNLVMRLRREPPCQAHNLQAANRIEALEVNGGWRFDIESAPKGTTKTVDGPKGPREIHVPEPVFLACRDGQTVTLSRWLPKEGRWNMLASGEQPLAWRPYPKHPNAEAS